MAGGHTDTVSTLLRAHVARAGAQSRWPVLSCFQSKLESTIGFASRH